jgi:hypothetical protein
MEALTPTYNLAGPMGWCNSNNNTIEDEMDTITANALVMNLNGVELLNLSSVHLISLFFSSKLTKFHEFMAKTFGNLGSRMD